MTYKVPTQCPECGHEPVTEVVYGLIRRIAPELQKDLQAKKKKLGGCMTSEDSPAYGCLACNWTVSLKDALHPIFVAMQKYREEIEAEEGL